MKMAKPMIIRFAIFVLTFLATVFSIISIAGNYWYWGNGAHLGLWKSCGSNGITNVCIELSEPDSEFRLCYFYSGLYEQG